MMDSLVSEESPPGTSTSASSKLIPKKQRSEDVHFSDGIVANLDELVFTNTPEKPVSRASEESSSSFLDWIDWLGEKFASFLGLSSPKYAYIIEESKSSFQPKDTQMCGDVDDPNTLILTPHKST
ncbi:hypothetical protein FGIG_06799 [Fasciola gigantica]|uniref:Uncharacterized protein n=1 Tax=Fasciola gigantica TaxID=46835 RepID=A0A504YF22_FASGI|nr:hypothetical protein FGIG_06799 [Fasciola gigantica]